MCLPLAIPIVLHKQKLCLTYNGNLKMCSFSVERLWTTSPVLEVLQESMIMPYQSLYSLRVISSSYDFLIFPASWTITASGYYRAWRSMGHSCPTLLKYTIDYRINDSCDQDSVLSNHIYPWLCMLESKHSFA